MSKPKINIKFQIGLSVFASLFVVVAASIGVSAATANTTISSVISSVISITTNGTVNVDVVPTGAGAQTIAKDTTTVSTNSPNGYTLQLEESTAATALTSGANTIPASAGTQAAPVAMAVNTWGYRVDGVGGFGAGPTSAQSSAAIGSLTFAKVAVSGSPNTLKTTASVAVSDTTDIWYGVAVNTSQASGTYTNAVTYTATAN